MFSKWFLVSMLALAGCGLGKQLHAADRDIAMAVLSSADDLFKKSQFDKALELAQRAADSDNSYAQAFLLIAQCQEQTRKPREAMLNYAKAEALARKADDTQTANKASGLAEKLAPGLKQVSAANLRMIARVLPVAQGALNGGQFETALDAFNVILAADPSHAEAKAGADKAKAAIDAKGNPIKTKIAEAMLAEVWYYIGAGKKEEAGKVAQELAARHPETAAGQEAAQMAANQFKPPAKDEQLALKKLMMEEKARQEKLAASAPPVKEPSGSTAGNISARPAPSSHVVDIDALDLKAITETKKLPKDKLVPTFNETFNKGHEFYGKAQPGSEGCQQNLRSALDLFIYCEALNTRIEEEKLSTDDIAANAQQASMLRYGCMKMTILGH